MEGIEGLVNQGFVDQMVAKTNNKTGTQGDSFDGDMFIKLLLTQLKNQDPFNTVETDKIMEQQAILSQVEQSIKQTDALSDVKATVDIGLSDISNTLANINKTLTTLVNKQNSNTGAGS